MKTNMSTMKVSKARGIKYLIKMPLSTKFADVNKICTDITRSVGKYKGGHYTR